MNNFLLSKWKQKRENFTHFDRRVWYLVIIRVINALGFSLILPFISIYLYSEKGVPMTIVGSFFLIAALARAGTQLMGGGFSDKMGRRKVMLFAAMGRTLTFLFLAAAIYYQLPILVIGIFVILSYGFGAMFMPAADALISDVVRQKDRVKAYAYQRMGLNLGWAIGPAIGGYLASASFHLLFLMASLFFLIAVFIVLIFIKDSDNSAKKSQFSFRSIKVIARDHSFLAYGILSFIVFSTLTQTYSTLTVYSVEVIKITKIQLGYLYSLNGLVIILFQLPGIKLINRMSLTGALALGAMFSGMSYIIVAISENFMMLAMAIIVLTFGEIFFIPAGTTLTSNWAPESKKGTYLGLYGLFQGMGRSFGPFYGGILLDHFLHLPYILWGTITTVAFVASFFLIQIKKLIPAAVNNTQQK